MISRDDLRPVGHRGMGTDWIPPMQGTCRRMEPKPEGLLCRPVPAVKSWERPVTAAAYFPAAGITLEIRWHRTQGIWVCEMQSNDRIFAMLCVGLLSCRFSWGVCR